MFPLFESIRIEEGTPLHLHWHQERITRSYEYFFKKPGGPVLLSLLKVPEAYSHGLVKCRFFYNSRAHTMEFSFYHPKKISKLKLVQGDHLSYSLKYTDRHSLEALSLQKGACDDILIIKNGKITDTSYANIILFDGENWVTPDEPLLAGTCRQRLLDGKKIIEKSIRVEDLSGYTSFKLINAMLDFDSQPALETANIVPFQRKIL